MIKQGALKKGQYVNLDEKGREIENNDKVESECEEPYSLGPPKECKHKKQKVKHCAEEMVELKMRMDMDRIHTIESFEEIGMTDPFRTKLSIKVAKKKVKKYSFEKEVYPNSITASIIEAAVNNGAI